MYLKVKGVKIRDFLKATGVSESNFKSKYSEFGGEVIAEILSVYSDISPYWLILGQGEMLTGHRPLIEIGNIKGDNNIYGDANTATSLVVDNSEIRKLFCEANQSKYAFLNSR